MAAENIVLQPRYKSYSSLYQVTDQSPLNQLKLQNSDVEDIKKIRNSKNQLLYDFYRDKKMLSKVKQIQPQKIEQQVQVSNQKFQTFIVSFPKTSETPISVNDSELIDSDTENYNFYKKCSYAKSPLIQPGSPYQDTLANKVNFQKTFDKRQSVDICLSEQKLKIQVYSHRGNTNFDLPNPRSRVESQRSQTQNQSLQSLQYKKTLSSNINQQLTEIKLQRQLRNAKSSVLMTFPQNEQDENQQTTTFNSSIENYLNEQRRTTIHVQHPILGKLMKKKKLEEEPIEKQTAKFSIQLNLPKLNTETNLNQSNGSEIRTQQKVREKLQKLFHKNQFNFEKAQDVYQSQPQQNTKIKGSLTPIRQLNLMNNSQQKLRNSKDRLYGELDFIERAGRLFNRAALSKKLNRLQF